MASFQSVHAQSEFSLPKITPLTPNAAEFNRYGDYKVSALTGRPEINIPVYTIETPRLSLPISLNYHASGIKVSQVATWAGLGFSLNAGGVISRTVRGLPDEVADGWVKHNASTLDIMNLTDAEEVRKYADLSKDSSPDFFSYNIPSKAGKFVYRKSLTAFEAVPFEPIEIKWTNSSQDNNAFEITDENGIRYVFEQRQLFFNDNATEVPAGLRNYIQSWYLTKMISADGSDVISFEYEIGAVITPISEGRSTLPEWLVQRKYYSIYSGLNGNYLSNSTSEQTDFINTAEPRLKQITFRNGKVVFHANTGRKDYPGPMLDSITVHTKNSSGRYDRIRKFAFDYTYFTTDNPVLQYDYRLKLTSLTEVDLSGENNHKTHKFFYNQSVKLPSTQSTAQDYWGYYNGRDQGFLPNVPPALPELQQVFGSKNIGAADRRVSEEHIQAGMLQKIVYPPGGYSSFKFESNKYMTEATTSPINYSIVPSTRVTAAGMTNPVTKTINFTWPNNAITRGTVNIHFSPHGDPGPFDVNTMQKVEIRDLTDNKSMGAWSHNQDFSSPKDIQEVIDFIKGHEYSIKITVRDEVSQLSPTYVTASIYTIKDVTVEPKVVSGGGLRIAEISHYTKNNVLANTEKYSYGTGDNGIGEILRSDKDFNENYYKKKTRVKKPANECDTALPCACHLDIRNEVIYIGEGSYSQVTLEGAHIIYNSVTKKKYGSGGEINGKTVYSADVNMVIDSIYNPNVPGQREYLNNTLDGYKIPSEKHYAYDNETGNYRLVKEKIYDYSLFETPGEYSVNVHRKMYNSGNCYAVRWDDFQRRNYDLRFGCYKLTRITERDHQREGGPIEKITQYSYDNKNHLFPTRTETTRSDETKVITVTTYPPDYASGSTFIEDMKSGHLINYPIERIAYQDKGGAKTILSGSLTKYHEGGKGLKSSESLLEPSTPVTLSSFKFSNRAKGIIPTNNNTPTAFSPDSRYKQRLVYNRYDNQANLLQYTLSNGPSTSFIWGYNGQYPVARIENATYTQIEGLTGFGTGFNLGAKGLSPTQENSLRSLSNTQVTTYTHKPLIGVSTITDPRGEKTTYTYDTFNRLEFIKDETNKLLEAYKYHYKN
ncbi:hypothetical protein LS482_08590 [Sinomicrobium kalidii]|uniref:hypothetical protein n=1 Tax=Sinomicrobium kalidii TaxID=2900738 RepID=UPI001E2D0996|nr:hypothetical protein [Sinomicrobium kalidii]UGU17924.1 hypothetical protein LS482_08590 [Sinomicrobium kalidii]